MKAPHKIDPSRLKLIERIASSLHAQSRRIGDEAEELRREITSLEQRKQQLTDPILVSGQTLNSPSVKSQVSDIDNRISEIKAQFSDIYARRDAVSEKWQSAKRLEVRCAEYLNGQATTPTSDVRHVERSKSYDAGKRLDISTDIQKRGPSSTLDAIGDVRRSVEQMMVPYDAKAPKALSDDLDETGEGK